MSSYFFIKNHRSRDLHKLAKHPSECAFVIPAGVGTTKEALRSWYQNIETDHCFLTMVEPVTPSSRCTLDNPPSLIHGWIADYDAPADWDNLETHLISKCGGNHPTWYCKTRSGFLRLVWEFAKPVMVDKDSAEPFLKQVSRDLKAVALHAGYDKTSTTPTQYFEIGEGWQKLGEPLPESFVFHAHVTSYRPSASSVVNVPFDAARDAVMERFGGRLAGLTLDVGSRVPLFWIDDGVDRIGGQLCEEGVICYSDRAGTPFVNWEEILGSAFINAYKEHQLQTTLGNVWTDGRYYWILEKSRAINETTENFTRRLVGMGLNPEKKKGQRLSELGEALNWLNMQRRVDGVGPFIFSDRRLINVNGKTVLNISFVEALKPASETDPSNWPFLQKFFDAFFDDVDETFTQKDVFYAWFQRFYRAVLERKKLSGQIMIISGPTGRGKTLLSHRIVGAAVGGHASSGEYLMGKTSFNKALSESPLWTVDDTTSACTFADNRRFTEMLKKAAANPTVEAHAKHVDAQEVEWVGRVMLSLNEDAHSLTVVPQQDQSNMDKIIGLRVSDNSPTDFGGDNESIEARIEDELPHFLGWLLNEFEPPAELIGDPRYGIKAWFHGTLRDAARDNSPIKVVMETLDLFCKLYRNAHPDKLVWSGTAAELLGDMAMMPEITSRNGTIEHERMHRQLKAVEEARDTNAHIREITSFSTGAGTLWVVNLSSEFDLVLKEGQGLRVQRLQTA
jgi:hypothetical protein